MAFEAVLSLVMASTPGRAGLPCRAATAVRCRRRTIASRAKCLNGAVGSTAGAIACEAAPLMTETGGPATHPRAGAAKTVPTVGIVGAGQLARMLIEAAIPLGIHVRLLAASEHDGAALVSPHVLVGPP